MGRCIRAIIAASGVVDLITEEWPELPRLDLDIGFSSCPVDAHLIDARVVCDSRPRSDDGEFALLTSGFRKNLRELSRVGQLAYVETEYFGGVGGQGAIVFSDGEELMVPEWRKAGTINDALRLLGMESGPSIDRFEAVGLSRFRQNDDIVDLIMAEDASLE